MCNLYMILNSYQITKKNISGRLKILLSEIHFRWIYFESSEKKVTFRVCLACKKSKSISCCVRIRLMVWLNVRKEFCI